MFHARRNAPFVLLLAALLAGCSPQETTRPTSFTLSGRVRLVGYLTAAGGQFLGTRVVNDADGVQVDLLLGQRVVARTLTSRGEYRFAGLGSSSYYARSVVFGPVGDSTGTLTIASRDVHAADTLVLASHGDLYPAPNPIDARGQVAFDVPQDEQVRIQVLDTGATVVRHIADGPLVAGLHVTFWDGKDDTLGVMPAGNYWMTFESGTDRRAQLLFK
jgi:hypothetical protein